MMATATRSRAGDTDRLVSAARDPGATADAAFATLYERHKDEVFGFLLKLVGDAALAEDLLQEAFFRVFDHLERFDAGRSLRAWVFQVARNAALDALRRRRKERRLGSDEDVRDGAPAAAPLEALTRDEARRRAADAIARLDDDDRALLLMRHGLELTQVELAEAWSCTDRTIRNRLERAAGALVGLLAAPGGDA